MLSLLRLVILSLCTFGMLVISGCGSKIDPSAPNGMYLNGRSNQHKLKEPVAFLQMIEPGGYTNPIMRGSIIYADTIPSGPVPRGGIEVHFNLSGIEPGQTLELNQDNKLTGFDISYYPRQGAGMNQGKMLAYSVRTGKGGSAKVRFDQIEPRVGGKIKGVILEATMDGYYDSMDFGTEELSSPRELKIYNWAFDTTFQAHPFSGF